MRLPFLKNQNDLILSPSDWVVLGAIGVVALSALAWVAVTLSERFTIEVPSRGGTFSEGIVGTPRFINPILALSDTDRDMVALVFSGLLRAAPDGSLVPDIASGYSVSSDLHTYIFTIRDKATFHDGTPITADDVAFTVALAQNPAIKSPRRANWEGVTVTVIDPKTISFTLKEPYAPFLENMRMGILPKHLWGTVSAEEFPFSTLNIKPIGDGPYKLETMTTNASGVPTEVALIPFGGASHVPYISRIHFVFYQDVDSLGKAVAQDSSLAAHSVPPASIPRHTLNEAILGRVFGVFFNQNQNGVFADKAVRAALNTTLDKQSIVSTLIGGYETVLDGPLPPQSITRVNNASTSSEERLATAAALLEKAGWTKGADGVFVKKNKKTIKHLAFTLATEIGRASCRERVYVLV